MRAQTDGRYCCSVIALGGALALGYVGQESSHVLGFTPVDLYPRLGSKIQPIAALDLLSHSVRSSSVGID